MTEVNNTSNRTEHQKIETHQNNNTDQHNRPLPSTEQRNDITTLNKRSSKKITTQRKHNTEHHGPISSKEQTYEK